MALILKLFNRPKKLILAKVQRE